MSARDTVGVLGGTFDPVHYGHLEIARTVRRTLALSRVTLMLAARPPHKPAAELAPVATMLPNLTNPPGTPGGKQLPDGYREADANGDGVIDAAELAEALRQLHPGLARWAPRILDDADRSSNNPIETELHHQRICAENG